MTALLLVILLAAAYVGAWIANYRSANSGGAAAEPVPDRPHGPRPPHPSTSWTRHP